MHNPHTNFVLFDFVVNLVKPLLRVLRFSFGISTDLWPFCWWSIGIFLGRCLTICSNSFLLKCMEQCNKFISVIAIPELS